jgi:hypothetical protein
MIVLNRPTPAPGDPLVAEPVACSQFRTHRRPDRPSDGEPRARDTDGNRTYLRCPSNFH